MSGLILHAGAHEATRAEVALVPTPEPTKTWQPIPHLTVVDLVLATVQRFGMTVRAENFGLYGKGGVNMFGVLELSNGQNPDDYALLLGVRNSHNKDFAAGGALGSRVFVCDNLAFSGEITFSKIHSPNILELLPGLVEKAVSQLVTLRGWQDTRIEAYKDYTFRNDVPVHDFIIRAMAAGVIVPSMVDDVLREWRTPTHPEFEPRTAWSLFNGFTEVLKGSLPLLSKRTVLLHAMMDKRVGLTEARAQVIGSAAPETPDFEIVEE